MANIKQLIGFVRTWPKLIIQPQNEPQYEGGDVVVITSGIYLPIEQFDEDDD